jgi:uncharacterized YigZ family protein
METHYKTLLKAGESLFKDKGSKHLGATHLVRSKEQALEIVHLIKKEHNKANHVCYAYRLRSANGIIEHASDDGEPSNSAGAPILGQLKSHELENCLVTVVRYFGGTKLGVSGLINAYRTAALLAIKDSMIHLTEDQTKLEFECDYAKYHLVLNLVKKFNATIVDQSNTANTVKFEIETSDSKLGELNMALSELG